MPSVQTTRFRLTVFPFALFGSTVALTVRPLRSEGQCPYRSLTGALIRQHRWWLTHANCPANDTLPADQRRSGVDGGGTDVFAKLLYGFRLSVLFGIALTIISSSLGVLVGALQGYLGGLVDLIGQRVVEIFAGLPILLVLIILASIVEPNVFWLLGILALFSWMALVGVVRAEFLRARNFEFVLAARSLGVSNLTILRRHVLPNAMVATLTYLAVHTERVNYGADCAGLSRVRIAHRLTVPRADAVVGKGQPSGALARVLRVRDVGDVADVADLYWRGGEG